MEKYGKGSSVTKVSIVTVVYNNKSTIEDAILSVLNQDYPDIEHIIIDGGSTDGTLEVLERYRERLARVVSEPDKGIYDAMNKGVHLASGEIVGILNSDDLYSDPGVISKIVSSLEASGSDAVYADLKYVDHSDLNKVLRVWKAGKYSRRKFLYGWMPPHPTFFVKRSMYLKHGVYKTDFRNSGDYELMLRMLFKHNISVVYLPEFLIKMRAGGVSNSTLRNRMRANAEDRRAWEINGLTPLFFTTWLKPIRKLGQFKIFKFAL